jgi:hypothetical protein
MMKKTLVLSVAAATFMTAVVAFIPATLIESAVNPRFMPTTRLQVTGGTIWAGTANVIVAGATPQLQDVPLEIPVKWSVAPSSLLRLRLGFDVIASGRQFNGSWTAEAGLFDLQLRNMDVTIAMELLARIRRELSLFQPRGEFQLTSVGPAFTVDYAAPHAMAGRLNFAANHIRIQSIGGLPISAPLGSYHGNLMFEPQRVSYQIEKSSGMLALNGGGHVVLGKTNEFRYQGFASAPAGSPAWVASLLGRVGRLAPDGRVNIDYKTSW